jgi:peptide/nickel transport system ATP-binding protein
LLLVSDLRVTFAGGVRAVRGVGFSVSPGEVLAVVGESGAGKSATALAVMGLLPATARTEGSVRFRGRELLGLRDRELAEIRGNDIALIFQDSAFTPVYRIGDQIAEAVRLHARVPRRIATARAVELLAFAGIPDTQRAARAFPHELSGGQLRRAMIAMTVAAEPAVILADEPTSGLDPTAQARTLDALQTVQTRTGAALVLITHDLGVVAGRADRVMVMYAGRPVEAGPVDDVFDHPRMPYTIGLLNAVARLDGTPALPIPGRPTSSADPGEPSQSASGRSSSRAEIGWSPSTADTGGPPSSADPGRLPSSTDPGEPSQSAPGRPSSPTETGSPPTTGDIGRGCAFAPRCVLAVERCLVTEPLLRPVGAIGHRAACLRAEEIGGREPQGATVIPLQPGGTHTAAGGLPILEVDGLVKHYPLRTGPFRRRTGTVRAVDGIGFDIRTGEALGLVGESGCGKTTALLETVRLAAPPGGRIRVFGRDTATLSAAERRVLRRDLQMVFQDPVAALDPLMTAGAILAEPLRAHGRGKGAISARIPELLRLVGLDPAYASRRPGELSGGQRQRVGIARALALGPRLLVMDEPFSALDVSVRAGIIGLLRDLKARLRLSYLLAAHDLAAVRQLADRVAVMRLGRIVEIGHADAVYTTPAHPYTRALLSAVPIPDPRARPHVPAGDEPRPDPPSGCRFRGRCPVFAALGPEDSRRCEDDEPILRPTHTGQSVACHYPERGGTDA